MRKPQTTNFRESLRYEYDLCRNDLVIDAGAHMGVFSEGISKKYRCHIKAFEPVDAFYREAVNRLCEHENVHIYNGGIGPNAGTATFHVQGDSSGLYSGAGETVEAYIYPVEKVLDLPVALLKLNIEGAEFDLLEAMLDRNLCIQCRNIQVQFHGCAPNAPERHKAIRERLLATHHLTYDFPNLYLR